MEKKTEQIKRAIEQKKQLKEHDQLSELIAQKVGSEFGLHLQKNIENFKLLSNLLETIERRIVENKIALPETQNVNGEVKVTNTGDFKDIKGDVRILNPEDFKTDIQKVVVENPVLDVQKVQITNPISEVKVKNQISLKELREDINRVLRSISDGVVGERIRNKQLLADFHEDVNRILHAFTDIVSSERIKDKQVLVKLRDDILPIRQVLQSIREAILGESSKNKKLLLELQGFLQKLNTKQSKELLEALKPLRFLSRDPLKPISVRLSDGERFYKALTGLSQAFYAASNTKKVEDLLQEMANNTDEIETKLDEIKTAIGSIGGITPGKTKTALLKGNQQTIILIPAVGKRLRILGAATSQEVSAAECGLEFATSNIPILFTTEEVGGLFVTCRIEGAVNEGVTAFIESAAANNRFYFLVNFEEF
jgi:hypothetical protein